jgi:hypothetical protein
MLNGCGCSLHVHTWDGKHTSAHGLIMLDIGRALVTAENAVKDGVLLSSVWVTYHLPQRMPNRCCGRLRVWLGG